MVMPESLALGSSSIARRPSFSASSFLPKPASISRAQQAGLHHQGARISPPVYAALIKAARAEVSFLSKSDYTHPKVAAKLRKAHVSDNSSGKHRRKAAGGSQSRSYKARM